MQPTHENIDRWLFDYTEGNLSADQEEQLELFLMNHPDLALDMDAWEQAKVEVAPISFNHKESLYKKRSYKRIFALAFLALLFTTSAYFLGHKNEETAIAQHLDSTKKTGVHATSNNNPQPLTASKTPIKQNIPATFFAERTLSSPVSSPMEAPRNVAEPFRSLATSNGTISTSSEVNNTAQRLYVLSNQENEIKTSSNLLIENNEFIRTSPLKGMKVGGYRTDFKSEELIQRNAKDVAEVSLGDLDLFRKLDHLLSKDIGLSNNQSYDYAVPNQSNLDLNFSSVGTTSQTRFQAISSVRAFESNTQAKMTNQVSLDGYSRNMRAGFGLQMNYDQFNNGLLKNTNVAAIFSPKIALTRKISLEPAVRFKMGTRTLDQQKLLNNSQAEYDLGQVNTFNFDSSLAIGRTLWYRDLDAGLTIHTPLFFLSAQLTNLFGHNENVYSNTVGALKAAKTFNLIAGTQYISRNEQLNFAPYVLLQHNMYRQELFGGFTFKAGKLQLGGSYSNLATGSVSIGYQGKNFALIGQSSYLSLASMTQKTFAHQLTLRINSSVSKKARRYISL
jgi:hypothetical protein